MGEGHRGVILLVSGGARFLGHPHLGELLVPGAGNRVPASGLWAADNGAFKAFDERAYQRLLRRITGKPGCLFVTAPDVVGDSAHTLRLFSEWEPIIRQTGQPVALVAQDGLTAEATPWGALDALFVGGSTRFKLGHTAAGLVAEANERWKWTHMGRVNTFRRLAYAAAIGCDSVDGTSYSRYSRTYVPPALEFLLQHGRQCPLVLEA